MMNKNEDNLMEKIVSLCKRRGFVFPGSEIYGGLANSWDYGPLGVELKNNIKSLWWNRFVHRRDDMVGIDAALIMNPKVWEASGHVGGFTDPLIECKHCHVRSRADQVEYAKSHGAEVHNEKLDTLLDGLKAGQDPMKLTKEYGNEVQYIDWVCPHCQKKNKLTETPPRQFNLLFPTHIGSVEDSASTVYLRGELAQAMFVDFKNVLQSIRNRLPFGIAAQGKVFRNEITPNNFIFRTREFDLMEFEYFVRKEEWETHFEYWRKEMIAWMKDDLGLQMEYVHELEVSKEDRAHYSSRTIDFEYDYPFGKKELYGLAYRSDFDLNNHAKHSGEDLNYTDPETGEKFIPHVVEPTFGLDRSVLAVLLSAYTEEDGRIFLKLPPRLAPYKAAIFPLLANKPELVAKAREVYDALRKKFYVAWDDRGNIGKRYYAQDEIGTPFCITIDFDTPENGEVTIRDRDTAKQERIAIEKLEAFLAAKLQ
jgi:glycyl-tRNA synthetase